MPRAAPQLMHIVPSEYVYGDGGSSGRMGGDKLPFRHRKGLKFPIAPFLNPHWVHQADVMHQLMEIVVIIANGRRVRSLVAVLLKYPVGCLRLDAVQVNIDNCKVAGLLLGDAKDVPFEAAGVNSNHVRVALEEVA